MTADEVAEMERRKKEEEGSGGGGGGGGNNGQAGVAKGKESDKINPNNNTNRTPNRPPHPMGAGSNGNNTTPSGGSLKRKAGPAGLSSSTPGKKSRPGNGRLPISNLASESEDDVLEDLGDEDD